MKFATIDLYKLAAGDVEKFMYDECITDDKVADLQLLEEASELIDSYIMSDEECILAAKDLDDSEFKKSLVQYMTTTPRSERKRGKFEAEFVKRQESIRTK